MMWWTMIISANFNTLDLLQEQLKINVYFWVLCKLPTTV